MPQRETGKTGGLSPVYEGASHTEKKASMLLVSRCFVACEGCDSTEGEGRKAFVQAAYCLKPYQPGGWTVTEEQ